jgi:hypothetical protein
MQWLAGLVHGLFPMFTICLDFVHYSVPFIEIHGPRIGLNTRRSVPEHMLYIARVLRQRRHLGLSERWRRQRYYWHRLDSRWKVP